MTATRAEIARKAREVHPLQLAARVLVTAIAFVFTAVGWLTGTIWFLAVFSVLWAVSRTAWLWTCVQFGFAKGAHAKVVPK